jgi:hypothetical protein
MVAARGFSVMTHGSDETLHVSLLSVEKGLQRRLSSSTKLTNITDFLKLKSNNV